MNPQHAIVYDIIAAIVVYFRYLDNSLTIPNS